MKTIIDSVDPSKKEEPKEKSLDRSDIAKFFREQDRIRMTPELKQQRYKKNSGEQNIMSRSCADRFHAPE